MKTSAEIKTVTNWCIASIDGNKTYCYWDKLKILAKQISERNRYTNLVWGKFISNLKKDRLKKLKENSATMKEGAKRVYS